MGDTENDPEGDDTEERVADDEEPNPPYDPPAGHTWVTWLS